MNIVQFALAQNQPDDLPPVSLEELAHMRGAIWPKLGVPSPWGPRPYAVDNINMVDYIEVLDQTEREAVMRAYVATSRRYRTTTMGPIVDPGYHGQIPSCDWRANFDHYLDVAEVWERAYNVRVVHFLRPDAGVAGLEWNVDDCRRELEPLFLSSRAQTLMRAVSLAWEPGGRYGYDNAWWVEMCAWMASVFPHALRCVHLPADQDAPVGPADDGHPELGAWAWGNVAPYLHCWLVQNGGYADGSTPVPTAQFLKDFSDQFNPHIAGSLVDRFERGYAGWPTFSAWSARGIVPIPFEYWAFAGYWSNFPSGSAHLISDAAMDAGAVGFMDDGGDH